MDEAESQSFVWRVLKGDLASSDYILMQLHKLLPEVGRLDPLFNLGTD